MLDRQHQALFLPELVVLAVQATRLPAQLAPTAFMLLYLLAAAVAVAGRPRRPLITRAGMAAMLAMHKGRLVVRLRSAERLPQARQEN